MKILRIVGHPITVLCMFLLLLISGEGFGGFYLIYVLLGLTGLASHSVLAVAAIAFLVAGYNIPKGNFLIAKPILYIVAVVIMNWALFTFFRDSKGYNDSTFEQGVPMTTFVLFGLCAFCNICLAVAAIVRISGKGKDQYKLSA